jgi:hypothetical protein
MHDCGVHVGNHASGTGTSITPKPAGRNAYDDRLFKVEDQHRVTDSHKLD